VRARCGSFGRPVSRSAQVARELGVNEGTLGNWVTVDRRRRDGGDAALSEPERAELSRLRREVAELRMERDVLSLDPWTCRSLIVFVVIGDR
jgi:transposase